MNTSRTEQSTVSVIIPCYNLGQYLDEAVESVLSQTYPHFEIVVVDDGSTDQATRSLLEHYRRPKTRIIRTPHRGLAEARNIGIRNSSGAYLCALDADDRLDSLYLTKTVEVLDRDTSLTFVSAWLRTFGEEEWEWKPECCDLPTLLWENTVLTASLVRRETVIAVGAYDTAMPIQGDEDWDLWLTLVSRGYRGVILPEVLFHYRRRPDSMSTVCWHGPGHLPLAAYRVNKYRETYRTCLTDVLLHQDADIADLLRQNDALERYLTSELDPFVMSRSEELARLTSRLPSLEVDRTAELESALKAAHADVAALRSSMSWRMTRPLRAAYGWWLGRRSQA